jgi:hypothetical protein
MKKILLVSLLLTLLLETKAQTTQNIRGNLTDKESKYPLIGVTVVILGSNPIIGTVTDQNGDYKLNAVPVGRYVLKITYLGYIEQTIPNVVVTSGKEVIMNFQLTESVTQMDEIVVKPVNDKTATNSEMAVVSARSFNLEEAMRYAGSRNDPARMAANFAGVSGASDGRNDIIIRGNSPLGLLWRMNGIEIPNPNHFGASGTTGGPVSMLNTNLLDKSDFMTAAFPANFGNATSGVFDLQMRNGNNEKREYLGQVGFNGFEFGAEGPFSKNSKASYLINYRYSTLGVFKAFGVNFGTGAAIPLYQDLSFKFNFPTKKYGKFTVFGMGGLSYIELLDSKADTTKKSANFYGNDGRDIYFTSNMGVVGASHEYFFNSSTYGKLVLAFSATSNTVRQDSVGRFLSTGSLNPNAIFTEYGNKFIQDRISLNYSINKKFNAKNTLNTGINIDRIGIDLKDSTIQTAPYGVWKKLRNSQGANFLLQAWVQWQHRFSERLTLNTGLHYQQFSLNNDYAIEPRLGIKYQLNDKMALNFGAGVHNQIQPLLVYYIQTRLPNGSYESNNKNLSFTNSNQFVLGFDYNFAPAWRLKAETYYQKLRNVPVTTFSSSFSMLNAGANFDPLGRDSLASNGSGQNYGFELTIEKFFSKGFYLLSSNSLFESKYTGSDGVERNTAFNGNFVFNILGGKEWKLGQKHTLSIDTKVTYAGGRRHTPINIEKSVAQSKTVYYDDQAFTLKYKDYFRTDVKIGFKRDGKRISQQWSVQIDNIFNTQNVFLEKYSVVENKLTTTNQLGLFIVPQYRILF